ncbi:tetratricopeptide repeat protein, partial [Acinetobacter pittii]
MDAARAMTFCREALSVSPDNPRLHHQFGRALLKAGRTDEAVASF